MSEFLEPSINWLVVFLPICLVRELLTVHRQTVIPRMAFLTNDRLVDWLRNAILTHEVAGEGGLIWHAGVRSLFVAHPNLEIAFYHPFEPGGIAAPSGP